MIDKYESIVCLARSPILKVMCTKYVVLDINAQKDTVRIIFNFVDKKHSNFNKTQCVCMGVVAGVRVRVCVFLRVRERGVRVMAISHRILV